MSERIPPAAANIYPPTPEGKLMGLIAAQLFACRNRDEENIRGLKAEGEEGLRMEVRRFVRIDADERYVPIGDKLPAAYETLVWKPNYRNLGIEEITTRTPIYEERAGTPFWPNDALIVIKGELRHWRETKILLNGFGWFAYEDPKQIILNTDEGDESIARTQNVLRPAAEGVSLQPRFTAEEVLFILDNSEIPALT